ncbi:MAG: CRTAC1 family protein [Candidatus Krumholzibacteriia bacterium]
MVNNRGLGGRCKNLVPLGCFLTVISLFLVNDLAALPWYAQDYNAVIYDWQAAKDNYPELSALIRDSSAYYLENFAKPGDAQYFENSIDILQYIGMTGLHFGGIAAFASPDRKDLNIEDNFYHSSDPSSLTAWRTGSGITVRWGYDHRFLTRDDLSAGDITRRVDSYIVVQTELVDPPVETEYSVLGQNYLEIPEVSLNATSSYSYRVVSKYDDPYDPSDPEVEYSFTPVGEGFVVGTSVENVPHFWLIREDFQEAKYHDYLNGTLGEWQKFDFTIKFGVDRVVDPSGLVLERILHNYPPGLPTIDDIDYTGTGDGGIVTFTLSESIGLFKQKGGIAYRLHYSSGGQNIYFPQQAGVNDEEERLIWSSVNNRVMFEGFLAYHMRIDSNNQTWRNTFLEIANRLTTQPGVTPISSGPQIVFDGLFWDVVTGTYFNGNYTVIPYEFVDSDFYLNSTYDFIHGIVDSGYNGKIFLNTKNVELIEMLKAEPGYVDGFMFENWAIQPQANSWYSQLLPACWIIHSGDPAWETWIEHGIDLNFHIQYPGEGGVIVDEYATDVRQQALTAFLMSRNTKTVLVYGDWKDYSDLNQAPNILGQVSLLPEQLLSVGDPDVDDPFNSVSSWPSASEVAAVQWDPVNSIQELKNTVPGIFSDTVPFAFREFPIDLGTGEFGSIFGVIDVSGVSGTSQVNLRQIIGPNLPQNTYYRLRLENDIALVTEGATFWSEAVSADELWESTQGQAAIFFTHSIRSPWINPLSLTASGATVLDIEANQWNGVPLESLRVKNADGHLAGWDDEFPMVHQSGDIYSYTGPVQLADGTHTVDVIALGTDGLMFFGKVDVVVGGGLPVIAQAASDVLVADNPEATSAISVEVTSTIGESLTVALSDPELGFREVPMMDDGVYPDLVAGDDIFTTPLVVANLPVGTYSDMKVAARALDGTGNIIGATIENIQVQAVETGMKLVDVSIDTNELVQMDEEEYASIYFEAELEGLDQGVLAISKDEPGSPPSVFAFERSQNGVPIMVNKTFRWLEGATSLPVGVRGLSSIDYNQDQLPDLFVCANEGDSDGPRLYRNNGSGYDDVTATAFQGIRTELSGAYMAAWADYNQDGYLDLFVARNSYTGSMVDFPTEFSGTPTLNYSLFKGSLEGTFSLAGNSGFWGSPKAVITASWNDVDHNGYMDLVLGVYTMSGSNPRVYLNLGPDGETEGDCDFLTFSSGFDGKIRSLRWIDANHDAYMDLLAVETDSDFPFGGASPYSRAAILKNMGGGVEESWLGFSVDQLVPGDPTLWYESLVGDLNLDGQEDRILLPHDGLPSVELSDYVLGDQEPIPYYQLSLPLGMKPAMGASPPITAGGVCADFNGDHDLDLYLGRGNYGHSEAQPFFFKNVKPNYDKRIPDANEQIGGTGGPHWVQINLISNGNSNRSGVGSRVVLTADGTTQTRIVDGGSGRGSQNPGQLIFGLGGFDGSFNVKVTWPDGNLQEIAYGQEYIDSEIDIAEAAINSSTSVVYSVIPGSEKFSYQLIPGGADWVFSWDTSQKGDLAKDSIEWHFTGTPGPTCDSANPGTFGFGHPNVEVTGYANANGWHHILTLKNQICSPFPCPMAFVPHGGNDSTNISGQETTFGRFKACLSQ